ncbi:MAG: DUF4430 domain-containing protein [Oscillospiraceae bacterium]|nr:DUF4430 domain-containing protein [Oscillospiraceae bacterium]
MAAQKTNKRRWWIALVALIVVAAILAGLYFLFRADPPEGDKTVTVKVVHADQSEKEFTYETDDEYLGELLTEEGLVEGEVSEYGMYITKVDGEQAVFETDTASWALYENGEYASTGADQTVLDDGDEFSLVYTKDAS